MKSVKAVIGIVCIFVYLTALPVQAKSFLRQKKDTSLAEYMADSRCEDATIKKIIATGANVNARNAYGETPLMFAAFYGKTEIVKLLIEKGADVNAREFMGWTPLLFAARKGHTEIARILIENGADVMAKIAPDVASLGGDRGIRLILENRPAAFQNAFQVAIIHNHMVTAHVIRETYNRRELAKKKAREAIWGMVRKITAKK